MEELERLANSRSSAEERERAVRAARPTARQALRWPFFWLGVLLAPAVVLCVVVIPVFDEGHPPGAFVPLLYLFYVAPFAAPMGVWVSGRAAIESPDWRGTAVALTVLFLAITVASWWVLLWFLRAQINR